MFSQFSANTTVILSFFSTTKSIYLCILGLTVLYKVIGFPEKITHDFPQITDRLATFQLLAEHNGYEHHSHYKTQYNYELFRKSIDDLRGTRHNINKILGKRVKSESVESLKTNTDLVNNSFYIAKISFFTTVVPQQQNLPDDSNKFGMLPCLPEFLF